MFVSRLKEDLRRHEGVKLKPYRDTKDKLTIGIGRNLDDVGISECEAEYLLNNDINEAIRSLDIAYPFWKTLSENRQLALSNMMFNLGLPRLMTFVKMFKALRAKDFDRAADEAFDSKWQREDVSKSRSSYIIDLIRKG